MFDAWQLFLFIKEAQTHVGSNGPSRKLWVMERIESLVKLSTSADIDDDMRHFVSELINLLVKLCKNRVDVSGFETKLKKWCFIL